MSGLIGLDSSVSGRWLREVSVRPVQGVDERRRWDALMRTHHSLPFHGLFGKSLRHVAVREGIWLALLGWHAGAFKAGGRDRWIGWTPEQQFTRLHLSANTARFAVLPAGRVMNLASGVLGLSPRWLPGDFRDMHGYPVLLAETFIDSPPDATQIGRTFYFSNLEPFNCHDEDDRQAMLLRLAKVKQKVSGCFRTLRHAQAHCRISSSLPIHGPPGLQPADRHTDRTQRHRRRNDQAGREGRVVAETLK